MKIYSEEELLNSVASLCSASEQCKSDIKEKLRRRGASKEISEKIVERLLKEKFIDESRYAKAFVRDKYRFDKWGKLKIRMALKAKSISEDNIDIAFGEIDLDEYRSNLSSLIQNKRKSVKAENDYELRGKLIRFALGRGYEMDDILSILGE
jgi:regulatory protein